MAAAAAATASLLMSLALIAAPARAAAAADEAPRKYVAISLLGDKVNMVTRQDKTGSLLNANLREAFNIPGGLFDQAVLAAIDATVKKTDPKAAIFPLKLASAEVLGEPDKLLDGDRFVTPAVLEPTLKQLQASHLLLVTRHFSPSKIRSLRHTEGSGNLEGLGFYIDRDLVMRRDESSETHRGFLAPYTYFKLSLINLGSGKLERQKLITRGQAISSDRKEASADPWEVLTTVEKVEILREQIKDEIAQQLPPLMLAEAQPR